MTISIVLRFLPFLLPQFPTDDNWIDSAQHPPHHTRDDHSVAKRQQIIQVFKDKCRRLKTGKEKEKDVMVIDSDGGDISSEESV